MGGSFDIVLRRHLQGSAPKSKTATLEGAERIPPELFLLRLPRWSPWPGQTHRRLILMTVPGQSQQPQLSLWLMAMSIVWWFRPPVKVKDMDLMVAVQAILGQWEDVRLSPPMCPPAFCPLACQLQRLPSVRLVEVCIASGRCRSTTTTAATIITTGAIFTAAPRLALTAAQPMTLCTSTYTIMSTITGLHSPLWPQPLSCES